LKPSEFWELTFAEFSEMCEGYKWRREQQLNDLISHAWHTARLTMWTKEFPKLETLLIRRNSKPQTAEDMLAVVKILNAAFGGVVVEKEE